MSLYVFALLCLPTFVGLIVAARIGDSRYSLIAKIALVIILAPAAFSAAFYILLFAGEFFLLLAG